MALIIPSIINKSGSGCFTSRGDGPCTIRLINPISCAVNNVERNGGEERGRERRGTSLGLGWARPLKRGVFPLDQTHYVHKRCLALLDHRRSVRGHRRWRRTWSTLCVDSVYTTNNICSCRPFLLTASVCVYYHQPSESHPHSDHCKPLHPNKHTHTHPSVNS